jgi:hypothetical protein
MPKVNPQNTHTYLIETGKPWHTMAEGIGCNFLISNQSALPEPGERGQWRQVLAALDDLQMGWMRLGIIPTAEKGAWNDRAQAWDFAHPHFAAMKKVGRWAARRNCPLMFDPFAIPRSFRRKGAFLADDPRQFAERLILPVAQFIRREKLQTVRYLGLLNENIWGPGKEGFAAVREFYALYQGVRQVLDEHGFGPEVLGLLGPSNLSSWEWPVADFFAAGLDPDPLWVGYDQHLYLYHFDWFQENASEFMSLTELTERYLRRYADYAHKRGKPLLITELGNMYAGRLFWGERDFDGPRSHVSVLMDAELIVRGINQGVDGFLRWAFCVKGERDGRWSFVENQRGEMVRTPAVYPMYRLLMRAVKPRARVLRASVGAALGGFRYVFPAAVHNEDGSAALLLINDAPGKNLDVGLQLAAPFKGRQLFRSVCDETRKGSLLPPVAVSKSGVGQVMLTPSSLTVLSTHPLG